MTKVTVQDTTIRGERLPLVPLRETLAFPGMMISFDVGRDKSVAALESAMQADRRIVIVAQREAKVEEPGLSDIYTVGTVVAVRQTVRMPDETIRVLAEGEYRAMLVNFLEAGEMRMAECVRMEANPDEDKARISAYGRVLRKLFFRLAKARGNFPAELRQTIEGEKDGGALADTLAANVLVSVADKQKILECRDVLLRMSTIADMLVKELDLTDLEKEIQARVHESIDRNNREYYLREQMRVIESELGEADEEIGEYERQLKASPIAGEARERVEKELKRLSRTSINAPESSVSQNYIEYMLEFPWGKYTGEDSPFAQARKVLEGDHYGLEDVKRRILEYLAVRSIKGDMKGPIICLVGPPGVGKTSIARSIAHALNRKFAQMSLGGVHDEAEIRGHRRTYVGAMPGRVVEAIKTCGVMNPVFLFDEIDKMASDYRGDPASAMLETLDPEQNSRFRDHYMDAPVDLSRVLFITTANSTEGIPQPLLDRMEVIEISSYTFEEKVQIGKLHLWPKQLREHGLTKGQVRISDKALREVVDGYTREAGVRSLERELGKICRKAAVQMLEKPEGERKCVSVKPENLKDFLGAKRFLRTGPDKAPEVGVVNGLAWTSVGGETMPIEVAVLPGDGKLELTGNLGDVMKESAHIAWSYVRANAQKWGIPDGFRGQHDIHIHVPEGAVPKDGPSAGVALACAMVSAITGEAARQSIAMTGEITLRGRVLPIGGVKEKLLAAYRDGIHTILLPAENEKDLEQLPEDIRSEMDIRLMHNAEEAISTVLNMTERKMMAAG